MINWKASYDEGNKWLLLDVNPKTSFLEVPKIPNATTKKILSDLVIKLLITLVIKKIFFNLSAQTDVYLYTIDADLTWQ